jgi:hypothetical protein
MGWVDGWNALNDGMNVPVGDRELAQDLALLLALGPKALGALSPPLGSLVQGWLNRQPLHLRRCSGGETPAAAGVRCGGPERGGRALWLCGCGVGVRAKEGRRARSRGCGYRDVPPSSPDACRCGHAARCCHHGSHVAWGAARR